MPRVAQRPDRKAGQRQQRASPTEEPASTSELDLEFTAFDLDEAVAPLVLLEGEPPANTQDDDSDRESSERCPREQAGLAGVGRFTQHQRRRSAVALVAGRTRGTRQIRTS